MAVQCARTPAYMRRRGMKMIDKDDGKMTFAGRKEHIIKEATELFYRNGYDNTPIRELSRAVELSVAGIYYFFKDKEDILFTILNQSIVDLNDTIEAALNANDDPVTNIKRLITNLLKHVIKHKKQLSILNREDNRLNAEQGRIIEIKRRGAYELIKNELSRLQKQDMIKTAHLSTAVFTLFSMTTWFVKWYSPEGPLALEDIAAEMADSFFSGILK